MKAPLNSQGHPKKLAHLQRENKEKKRRRKKKKDKNKSQKRRDQYCRNKGEQLMNLFRNKTFF